MKRFCTRQATAKEDRVMYLTRTTCLFNQVGTVKGSFTFISAASSRPFVEKGFATATLFTIVNVCNYIFNNLVTVIILVTISVFL